MDLVSRKNHLSLKLTKVTHEKVLSKLEETLNNDLSRAQREELGKRIKGYDKNLDNLLTGIL
jgi:hypothetical protein